jgi:serine/threonine protein kinase
MMQWQLIIEKGNDKGQVQALTKDGKWVIGRSLKCEIPVDDEMLSREHCRLTAQDGKLTIEDLESRNGTQVNYRTVMKTMELKFGDVLQVGETEFRLTQKREDGLIGKTLSGYTFNKLLGRGGEGTVYLAKQINLDRDVAIKVLDEKLAKNSEHRKRFVAEAQTAATMNHRRLIGVFDIVEEGDIVFFSMEHMSGGSLSELISAKKKLAPKAVLRYLNEAAEGLVYLEEKGMVHRDIKPGNLMLNKEGFVKLGDFGTTTKGAGAIGGNVMGSPSFMSPEHIQGFELDGRSDLYSLGCTAFRLMAGMPPFLGNSIKEILEGHLEKPAPRFKAAVPSLSPRQASILDKLLAKEPADRFPNAQALIDAFTGSGVGSLSTEMDGTDRPKKKKKKRRKKRLGPVKGGRRRSNPNKIIHRKKSD